MSPPPLGGGTLLHLERDPPAMAPITHLPKLLPYHWLNRHKNTLFVLLELLSLNIAPISLESTQLIWGQLLHHHGTVAQWCENTKTIQDAF